MNKVLFILALTVPLLTAYEVNAGDLWLDVNVASYHVDADSYCYQGECDDFNELNYGLGLSYTMDDLIEWQAGFFRNSYDQHSNYAGIKFKHDFINGDFAVTPGILVGGVTGYDDTGVEASVVQMMALPSLSVSYADVRATIGYLPLKLIAEDSTDVVTFQLGYRF